MPSADSEYMYIIINAVVYDGVWHRSMCFCFLDVDKRVDRILNGILPICLIYILSVHVNILSLGIPEILWQVIIVEGTSETNSLSGV